MQFFHGLMRLSCDAYHLRVALLRVLCLSVSQIALSSLGFGSCLHGNSLRPLSDAMLLQVVIVESTASLEDFVAIETVLLFR